MCTIQYYVHLHLPLRRSRTSLVASPFRLFLPPSLLGIYLDTCSLKINYFARVENLAEEEREIFVILLVREFHVNNLRQSSIFVDELVRHTIVCHQKSENKCGKGRGNGLNEGKGEKRAKKRRK